jgi:flagellar protein FliO/FliZ
MNSNLHMSDWLSFAASFALVLGLMAVLLYALKKIQTGNLLGLPKRRMRVVETISAGPRQKIILLRVKNQEVLIGITPQGMSTLTTFTLSEEELAELDVAAAQSAAPNTAPMAQRFADLLKSASAGNQNKNRS